MKGMILICVALILPGAGLFAQSSGEDPYEPDGQERPVAAQMGTWLSRSLHPGDQDWFSLRSPSTGLLVAVTSGYTDTVITLYQGDEELAFNDDNGDEVSSLLEYPVQAGVDYTLCVEGYDEDEAGPYRFMVSFESIRDSGEPNDVVSQAISYRPGNLVTGYFLDPDDVDWYRIGVAAAGSLTLYTEGAMDTIILLYDSANNLIAEDDDSGFNGNARASARVSPGTVFARVSSYNGQLGRYTLRGLFFEPPPADRFEDDGVRIHAKDIGVGASQERNFTDSFDEDWARLQIAQRGTYEIFAEAQDSAALDTFLELYDSNDELIDANDDWENGLDARLRLELAPGTYYIKARTISMDPIRNSNYVLRVSR
jgi:hypothetical protein